MTTTAPTAPIAPTGHTVVVVTTASVTGVLARRDPRVVRRLAVAIVAAVAVAACSGEGAPRVETGRVVAAEVTETISAPAVVQASDRQPVAAAVPGVVAQIMVEDGARVREGDVVVQLVSDDVELALQQAQAAESALASSQAGVAVAPPGDAARNAAQQSAAELDADVQPDLVAARDKAEDIDDDKERAAAHKSIALLEEAYLEVRDAIVDAGDAAADQQNAVAASFSGALNQALDQASLGQSAQAAGAADAAAARAEDLTLEAPFTGIVELGQAATAAVPAVPDALADAGVADQIAGSLGGGGSDGGGQLRVGAPVNPGQPVFTVFDLSRYYVQADVDEVDAPQLEVGQSADVLLDAFPDRTFRGEITSVAIEARTSPTGGVAYPARIRLLEVPDDGAPRVGMTASAEITTRTVDGGITVPSRAVVRREGGQAVFVVRDGRARLVGLEVEALGEQRAAVRSDALSAGDAVIVSGYEDLADGDAVEVDDASSTPATAPAPEPAPEPVQEPAPEPASER